MFVLCRHWTVQLNNIHSLALPSYIRSSTLRETVATPLLTMDNTKHGDNGTRTQPDFDTLTKTIIKYMVENVQSMVMAELESKTRKSSSGYGTGESETAVDDLAQSAMVEVRNSPLHTLPSPCTDTLPRTLRH
jgi:hypothetical protein